MTVTWHWTYLLLCVMGTMCLRGQNTAGTEAQFSCGLNAAYIFLNRAGHHAAYAELVREFEDQGTPDSLLAIRNVLAKHGCLMVGIKADPEYFLDNAKPAIVYLELDGYSYGGECHFSYLVKASRSNGVEFIDPVFDARKAVVMTWDSFMRIYKGFALVAHE
jgi:ABC-type bacteriocin/lantibiotic exporter with double-glycine peptidase domain